MTTTIYRGTTVLFSTIFYGADDTTVIQPNSAAISIRYGPNDVIYNMVPPADPQADPAWTYQWDSRGVPAGTIYYSIHTGAPVPYSVQDGSFILLANPANLTSF